ncbi:zinc finger protein 518A [Neoarius graeffei]|uniref:zinc finger protein 518A n=1 Tax=Neoarius graeffei TaxID=443677 RepID=UPI00298D0AA0|nr:zinc finger protein 518A [Neoarius graeffei]
MEATPDDPPKSHDQNGDVEKDASVDSLPPSKELANQTEDTAYNDLCVQDETQSGESGTDNSHTESKASEKSPCKLQQGAIFSGKILSFCCSECKGDTTYSPNDLLKHFQGVHKGTLPTYPCDLCTFVTNEFSSLQRHRIGHRDTLVTCEICNDGVQYSLLLLTRHFIMCHSCNGLFRCKKCDFSTRDAGTFVQHIHHHNEGSHKCVKCPSISPTQGKVHSGKVHSGTFPFTCQFCGYGAARREYLSKHMAVAHGDEMDRTNRWRSIEDNSRVNSPGLKLLLKKSPPAGGSREPQWMSKLNSYPGVGLLDHSGRLFNPEKTLEETQQFLERAVGVKKEGNKWSKGPLKSEPQCSYPVASTTPQPKMQENELGAGSGILDPGNNNGLTVLMVKNKISIPPNCTTKVMGFKMVDGKKHLVLKVIPTKQEPTTKNETSPTNIVEDDEKTGRSPYSSLSERSGSLLSLDSGTKKDVSSSVKTDARDVENHSGDQSSSLDAHEANVDPTSNQADDEVLEISDASVAKASASHCADLSTINKEADFSENQCSGSDSEMKSLHDDHCPPQSTAEESKSTHSASNSVETAHIDQTKVKAAPLETLAKPTTDVDSCTDLSLSESAAGEHTLPEIPVSASDATQPSVADEATPPPVSVKSHSNLAASKHVESTKDHDECKRLTEQSSPKIPSPTSVHLAKENETSVDDEGETSLSENAATLTPFPDALNGQTSQPSSVTDSCPSKELLTDNLLSDSDTSPQKKTTANDSSDAKDGLAEVDTVLQNSPNQEVFSFHNYSKETFGSSPDFLDADEHSQEDLEEDECEDDFDELKLASDWSLTLPASPPLVDEQSEEYVGSGEESSAGVNEITSASENKSLERVSDSDIEVDECVATVDDLPITAMTETDKGACLSESEKKEEDFMSSVLEGGPASLSNATGLGKVLEEHSDAIISQQLEKEKIVSSAMLQDSNKPTKTTLRILQMPEGKKQMFLQTTETPYAVPVQLTSGQGFKLITKSCASKVNVSYVKPGIEIPSKGSGLSLTLNGGRIGMSAQSLSGEGKGHASLLQTVSSNGGRYFVSASALKGPLLLSGTVKSPSEQTINAQPMCYLVQRPLPVSPSTESTSSTSKTVLTTRPVLAMPVKSADKAVPLQTGRQAYLVRYISPAKSRILVNSSNEKGANQGSQANEGGKSRVFLKIVRSPNGTRFLSTTPYTSAKKPLYVAASSLQSPYLLMSSDWSAGLKTSNSAHSTAHKLISAKLRNILPQSDIHPENQVEDGLIVQKSSFLPMHARPRSQRKRRRRILFAESFETSPKTRRMSTKALAQKEASSLCEPVAKDVERTLRLSPFSPFQQIKCPRQNQPVVVLNHPDADIPEVTNIMKSVNRYKGEVIKVALSENTVRALSEWSVTGPDGTLSNTPGFGAGSQVQPSGNNVRERFILRLKLKKTRRNKYEVVRLPSSTGSEQIPMFSCWFCGRVFNNQEEWIGHGQRHLMEATRDWNKLF